MCECGCYLNREILGAEIVGAEVSVVFWGSVCKNCDAPAAIEVERIPIADLPDEPRVLEALAPRRRGLPFIKTDGYDRRWWVQPLWRRDALRDFLKREVAQVARSVVDDPRMADETGVEIMVEELMERLEQLLSTRVLPPSDF